ncbi:MAG: hypothetical protein ALAOOOJD_02248 [bacterium]|nr:hypothetical protein [bacterium]
MRHEHARALNIDQGDAFLIGDGLDDARRTGGRGLRDQRSGASGTFGVQHANGNILFDRWQDGARMQNFRAKICQLRRFVECHLFDATRLGKKRRIGAEDAVHVRPDLNLLNGERCTEDGGGIIRAAAPYRCGETICRRADKALRDHEPALLQPRQKNLFRLRVDAIEQRRGARKFIAGD